MQIIAGKLKGQTFNTPKGHKTHPMSDRIKNGLFNSLGDITKLNVLDAFAGSGALSFEAISRGALSVIAIDADYQAFSIIKDNVSKLGLKDQVKVSKVFLKSWLKNNQDLKFDLILADPPYHDINLDSINLLPSVLKTNGILVLSLPKQLSTPDINQLIAIKDKQYGDAQLVFYQKIS
jgi:16S rRNA (guanine(966)-N(2))-methyltransferase RsmD